MCNAASASGPDDDVFIVDEDWEGNPLDEDWGHDEDALDDDWDKDFDDFWDDYDWDDDFDDDDDWEDD